VVWLTVTLSPRWTPPALLTKSGSKAFMQMEEVQLAARGWPWRPLALLPFCEKSVLAFKTNSLNTISTLLKIEIQGQRQN
jgi:hypothetical protein